MDVSVVIEPVVAFTSLLKFQLSSAFAYVSVASAPSTVIPAPLAVAASAAPEARTMFLSSTVKVVELIVVVVPFTVKSPLTLYASVIILKYRGKALIITY